MPGRAGPPRRRVRRGAPKCAVQPPRELAARRLYHGPRLHQALLQLAARIGVGHHAAPRAEPDSLAARLERADRHVQLQPRNRAGVADRPCVGLASARLELGDHPHGADLGRAGDRARRERGAQELGSSTSRRRVPVTVDTRCQTPGASRARSAPAPRRCRTRRRGRGRCASGRRSSRSRPGPWPSAGAPRRRLSRVAPCP